MGPCMHRLVRPAGVHQKRRFGSVGVGGERPALYLQQQRGPPPLLHHQGTAYYSFISYCQSTSAIFTQLFSFYFEFWCPDFCRFLQVHKVDTMVSYSVDDSWTISRDLLSSCSHVEICAIWLALNLSMSIYSMKLQIILFRTTVFSEPFKSMYSIRNKSIDMQTSENKTNQWKEESQ